MQKQSPLLERGDLEDGCAGGRLNTFIEGRILSLKPAPRTQPGTWDPKSLHIYYLPPSHARLAPSVQKNLSPACNTYLLLKAWAKIGIVAFMFLQGLIEAKNKS